MSLINRTIGGKMRNCTRMGIPRRRLLPCGYSYCLKKCVPYENPSDPLSCSWYGGEWKLNIINFKFNLQRNTLFANENFGNIFSPVYNNRSAIEILTKNTTPNCMDQASKTPLGRIEYRVEWNVCPYDNYPIGAYTLTHETTAFEFKLLTDRQKSDRRIKQFLTAIFYPADCARSKYKVSRSVEPNTRRRFDGNFFPGNCGSQALDPDFGEVLFSTPIFFDYGSPGVHLPPLTYQLNF